MTPQEKAKELYARCKKALKVQDTKKTINPFAKECAVVVAGEMLDNAGFIWGGRDTETGKNARDGFRDYWTEVGEELEKL